MKYCPKVSVIMSTFNTPDLWLCQAIESILNQSYKNIEFIIVDDYSKKSIEHIIERYQDERIYLIKNKENKGLTKSLNIALNMATGEYIARMDSDDISLPERLKTQVEFMEANPEIIVCGTYRRAFGIENKNEIWDIPTTRKKQQIELFFYNCGLTHPTAMFRRSMLVEHGILYNEKYIKAQDYGIWVQCTRYAPMAVIPRILLKYRKSSRQVTSNREDVKYFDSLVKTDQLTNIGIFPSIEEKKLHLAFCDLYPSVNAAKLFEWVNRLDENNIVYNFFDKKLFTRRLRKQWYLFCKKQLTEYHDESYRRYYDKIKKYYYFGDFSIKVKTAISRVIKKA